MADNATRGEATLPRILFFSAYPGFSGSHRMALQIAVACRKAGHDVIVAAPAKWEILDRAAAQGISTVTIDAPRELLEFGKTILKKSRLGKIAFGLTKLLPYNFRARTVLRARKIDIVYAAQERAVLQIGLAARLAHIPLLWHIQSGLTTGSRLIHAASKLLSSRIVCVSHAVAEDAAQMLGLDSSKSLRVIHNALPDRAPDAEDESPSRDPAAPLRLLFAGSLVPEKGPHHLLEAMAGLASTPGESAIRLQIAGPARDAAYLRFLESRVRDEGLEPQVEFLGYRDDIPDLMARCDIVVCPSVERERLRNGIGDWEVNWKEGFCLVALEAMRAAKPVVASDTCGLQEVVADGESGVCVPPGDVPALTSVLRDLLADPDRRRRLGQAGRRRFLECFSVERMTAQFLREFESIGGP